MIPSQKVESRIFETTKTYDALKCLCYEAREFGFASVQVFPCMVSQAREMLEGYNVLINALISYPHGGFSIDQKAAEAKEVAQLGADMVEVVVNTREIKSHNYEYIYREMAAVKNAVCDEAKVKFNIEIESLTDEEVEQTCMMAVKAGIDYIATSTGLYHTLDEQKNDVPLVTSEREVMLLKAALKGKVLIQAEGNITHSAVAAKLLRAGADTVSSEYAAQLCSNQEGK